MPVMLSGVLRGPYGDLLPDVAIRFDALRTSETVLKATSAEALTDSGGEYAVTVEYGRYRISAKIDRVWQVLSRDVPITTDTTATDLNQLLVDQQTADDATSEVILEMRAVAAEARSYRDEAAVSAAAAADDEAAADQHRIDAEAARDAANVAGQVYADTAAGLSATSDGQYFKTPAATAEGFLTLYRNDSGAATEIETFPSLNGLTAAIQIANEQTTRLNRSFSARAYSGESLRADFAAQAYGIGDTTGISRAVADSEMFDITRPDPKWVFQPVSGGAIELVEVPAGELAHEWDPVTGAYRGMLREPARTNRQLHSEDFTKTLSWVSSSGVTFSANSLVAPDGSITATGVDGDGYFATNRDLISYPENTVGTASIYLLAPPSGVRVRVSAYNGQDLLSPTVWESDGSYAGWVRVELSFTTDASESARLVVDLQGVSFGAWGAQIEAGAGATSYIPTTGNPATRTADDVRRMFDAEYRPAEGAIELTARAPVGTTLLTLGSESIVSDSDDVKTYALEYTADPGATELVLGEGYHQSLIYHPRTLT